jgi:dTDP-4-amino-4,6-dideoxygalactose transaminase
MTPTREPREVPFFNYRHTFASQEDAILAIVRDVIRRGAFIMQSDVLEFEQQIAAYLGVKYCFGVANCTDALVLGLRAAGVGPGDEVIFPSHTMVASPSAAALLGATPVPVDMAEDGLMDPDAVAAAVTPRTRVIMPVQLNGRTCQMDRIQAIADEHGLSIVEDSAQGLGSRYKGRFAGTFGLVGTFSFYPAKILGCMGDGGALVTNDDEVAAKVRLWRDHGRTEGGDVACWGVNSRLDNLHAAVLAYQFRSYQATIDRRRAIASMYQEALGDLEELKLPPPPNSDADHYDVFQNYELQAERRDDLRAHLKAHGVGTLIQWGGKAVHQFAALGFRVSLPATERFFERCLMLPMNLSLTDDDVAYVCEVVRGFYRA